ncbi:MAG: RNA ligase family protein [Ferrovibrionaceae bacterium]
MTDFFRFPHTPHVAWLGAGQPRDDKVLSPPEVAALLSGEVIVEEKVDGANLGLSLGEGGMLRAQNRGQYLIPPYSGQFARLPGWIAAHGEALARVITPGLILFGEWCAARHSLDYDHLPDWFLLFDVYDREAGRFWSVARRNAMAEALGFDHVPRLAEGRFTVPRLKELLAGVPSRYRQGPPEGLVIRRDDADHCLARAKLVRADFTQAIEGHWRSRAISWNRLG